MQKRPIWDIQEAFVQTSILKNVPGLTDLEFYRPISWNKAQPENTSAGNNAC